MGILEGLGLAGFAGTLAAIGGVVLALVLAWLGIRRGAKREEREKAKAEDSTLRAGAERASTSKYLEEKAKKKSGSMADLLRKRPPKDSGS